MPASVSSSGGDEASLSSRGQSCPVLTLYEGLLHLGHRCNPTTWYPSSDLHSSTYLRESGIGQTDIVKLRSAGVHTVAVRHWGYFSDDIRAAAWLTLSCGSLLMR